MFVPKRRYARVQYSRDLELRLRKRLIVGIHSYAGSAGAYERAASECAHVHMFTCMCARAEFLFLFAYA